MIVERNLRQAIKKSLTHYVCYYMDENDVFYVFLNGELKVKFLQ